MKYIHTHSNRTMNKTISRLFYQTHSIYC